MKITGYTIKKFQDTQNELYIHLGYLLYKSRAEILFRLKG